MFRLILWLISAVIAITFIRSVIGVLARGFSLLVNPQQSPQRGPTSANVPLTGELKRDPVCGTFVSTNTSVKHGAGADAVHFCSAACRDKFLASGAARRS